MSSTSNTLAEDFSNLTISEVLNTVTALLSFSDAARLEAEILLGHVLGKSRAQVIADLNIVVNASDAQQLSQLVTQRINHKPLQQIVGSKEFLGMNIELNDQVLIPREDTELLIELVVKHVSELSGDLSSNFAILEIGIGSGALLAGLIKNLATMPLESKLQFWGVDISLAALEVAKKNLGRIFDHKISTNLLESDLFSAFPKAQKFNLIVSNPPYLPEGFSADWQPELNYEPRIALVSGEDGLDTYRRLFAELPERIVANGTFWGEHLPEQVAELKKLAKLSGAKSCDFYPALDGQLRFIKLQY